MAGINDVKWNNVTTGSENAGMGYALQGSRLQTDATKYLDNELTKYKAMQDENTKSQSASNTADIIEQIRSGKTPERTGFYDGGAIAEAKYGYEKDQQALAFKRRAEQRAIAAAGRAAASHRASMAARGVNAANNKKYAESLVASMTARNAPQGGSEKVAGGEFMAPDGEQTTRSSLNLLSSDYDAGQAQMSVLDGMIDKIPEDQNFMRDTVAASEIAKKKMMEMPEFLKPENQGTFSSKEVPATFDKYKIPTNDGGFAPVDAQVPLTPESVGAIKENITDPIERQKFVKKIMTPSTPVSTEFSLEPNQDLLSMPVEQASKELYKMKGDQAKDTAFNKINDASKEVQSLKKKSNEKIWGDIVDSIENPEPPAVGTKEYAAKVKADNKAEIDRQDALDLKETQIRMMMKPKNAGTEMNKYYARKANRKKSLTEFKLNDIQKEKLKSAQKRDDAAYYHEKGYDSNGKPIDFSAGSSNKKYTKKDPDKFIDQLMKANDYIYDPLSMSKSTMSGSNKRILKNWLHKAIKMKNISGEDISRALAKATSPGFLGGLGPQDEVQFDDFKFKKLLKSYQSAKSLDKKKK